MRTTSPAHRSRRVSVHFRWSCKLYRYSCRHLVQNCSARNWTPPTTTHVDVRGRNWPGGGPVGCVFIVSNIAGDKGWGPSGSDGSADIGLALTMAATSAINMTSSLCVNWVLTNSANIASNTLLMVLICLSHTPPKCDAWGGLNSH